MSQDELTKRLNSLYRRLGRTGCIFPISALSDDRKRELIAQLEEEIAKSEEFNRKQQAKDEGVDDTQGQYKGGTSSPTGGGRRVIKGTNSFS
jgi:hypothetical protein